MIKGSTKMMCLLGYPVSHSLSPALHNNLCRLNKIDGFYCAFAPEKELVGTAIEGLKALGVIGFNVTYPYKETIIPFLDEIHEDAKRLNAVNTVVHKEGRLVGYNTDVFGVEQLLIQNRVLVENERVAILGTGGASRAVAVALTKLGVSAIDFYTRSVKSNAFIEDIKNYSTVRQLTYDDFHREKGHYTAIINGTPLGMKENINKRAIDPEGLNDEVTIIDLIYSPKATNLLTYANEQGYNIVNGYDMLYYQGLKAFSLWTGVYKDYYSEIKQLLL